MDASAQTEFREMRSLSSTILLAAPHQRDSNFTKTAVLVIEHSVDGAFGLILNRPLDLTLDQIASGLETKWGGPLPAPQVYRGGPVMPESAWLLHGAESGGEASRPIADGLSFTADLGTIKALLGRPRGALRLYLGYAGWGESQLDAEIAAGCWIIAPATTEAVFAGESDAVWPHMLSRIGINPDQWCPSSPSRH